MKKNSQEYVNWLREKNKKQLTKRTHRKAIKKKRGGYYHGKSKETGFHSKNIDKKCVTFIAPTIFSFIKNAAEVIEFFNSIIRYTSARRDKKIIFIDISNIQELTIDALMYILTLVNNLTKRVHEPYIIMGNEPKNVHVNKTFRESGFYHLVKHRENSQLSKNNDTIQIVDGKNCDTKLAKDISDFVCRIASVSIEQCRFLYTIMIELMSNTHKHAYSNRKNRSNSFPKWYCFVEYDKQDTISFTFMDTGAGIPNTVRKKITENIYDLVGKQNHNKLVVSALQGNEFRTSTCQHFRGKGLPKIRKICTEKKICNLHIISGKADVCVFPDSYAANDNDSALKGTLYFWQIKLSELKGESYDIKNIS